jgi:hypothetical protein
MSSNSRNVKLGVCTIFYKNIDLGYTSGGVEVTVKTDTHKTMVDQFGKTAINEYIMGREVMVKTPLAETTLVNLVAIMPGATLITGATGVPDHVNVTTGIGVSILDLAGELRLHPINKVAGDVSEDFVIPLAGTAGALKFSYKLDSERIFDIEFYGFPDVAGKIFSIGS